MRVSELDSPVVQPLNLAKRRKLQEMSTSASESEHCLDPRSLERSFENAATSAVKVERRSPLDHVKTELAENVHLKKVLLSSAEQELDKATRENDALTPLSQLYGRGSVEIVTSLDIQNRNVLHLPVLPITLVV